MPTPLISLTRVPDPAIREAVAALSGVVGAATRRLAARPA